MKRIVLFMPVQSQYGVLHHFTVKLNEALKKQGIDSHILEAKRRDPAPFLKDLLDNPPDCTLSFNGLLPDDQGRFFCDMIKIPHVACLVDSANSFLPLIRSEYSLITCVDRSSVDYFQGMGFSKSFFLPHAVESTLAPDPNLKRVYDVVMLSSCIDYEGLRSQWKKKFGASLSKVMEEAAEITLADQNIPYYLAFVNVLNEQVNRQTGIDPDKVDFVTILDEIEMYIRGKDKVELIQAIDEAKVDIFGSADSMGDWKKYLGKKKNVVIHDPIPFEQALAIMKQSKIVLNSCPWIQYGAHERLFAGMACGALVLTNENNYLSEQFKDGKSIVFYHHSRLDKANRRINEYLEDHHKRDEVVNHGRELVMKNHTWDQRAAQLLKELPPLLKAIKESH